MGHSASKIHALLKSLKVNKRHIYLVKTHFEKTEDICDHLQAGRSRLTRIKNMVNVVHARITQNPCQITKSGVGKIFLSWKSGIEIWHWTKFSTSQKMQRMQNM